MVSYLLNIPIVVLKDLLHAMPMCLTVCLLFEVIYCITRMLLGITGGAFS